VPAVVALITAASNPNPCRRIRKIRRTQLRTSERVYWAIAFDVLQHGRFACQVLREMSNFCCLPGRAGGSPNGLVARAISQAQSPQYTSDQALRNRQSPAPRQNGMPPVNTGPTQTRIQAPILNKAWPRSEGYGDAHIDRREFRQTSPR